MAYNPPFMTRPIILRLDGTMDRPVVCHTYRVEDTGHWNTVALQVVLPPLAALAARAVSISLIAQDVNMAV